MAAMHGTEPPLNLGAWLVQLGTLTGGKASAAEVREKGAAYAQALRAEFSPSVFTADSVRHVARHANAGGYFPTYAEVCRALIAWAKANPTRTNAPRLGGPARLDLPSEPGEGGHWQTYIARRLAENGDPANLRSLLRSRVSGDQLARIEVRLFPAEVEREREEAAGQYAPEYVAGRVALFIAWGPSPIRTIAARQLLGAIRRFRPGEMPEAEAELARLIGEMPEGRRKAPLGLAEGPPAKAASPPPAPAEPPAKPPPPSRQAQHLEVARLLRTFEDAVRRGVPPANAETRIKALRARLAALAEPEPETEPSA
jgi:hypothetical protein